jgi:thiamine-phosphate pyrophosphorylase
MSAFPPLYAIADASFGDPVYLAEKLFEGGARLVQIRSKSASARELLETVEQVLKIAPSTTRVVVNDRADVAAIADAAGVHLGQVDLPVAAARKILGPRRIVGISTHNIAQALEADRLEVDYIAVGPVFRTSTKTNADPVLGVAELGRICEAVQRPVVAIGGITLETAASVIAAGASCVAVIRDLLVAPDVATRVRAYTLSLGGAVK